MKITTLDKTVEDLLKHFYFIPRFQRPYSWEREQVEQFWNDTVLENTSDYFIGSLVLYKQGSAFGLVDGQQRVTTIILMLCALRNAFEREKLDSQAQGIQAIIEKTDIDNKKQFALQTESSYPYLQDKILKHGKAELNDELSSEEQLIRDTFKYIESRITDTLNNSSIKKSDKASRSASVLKSIRDKILGLKLITIDLDNEDDAYIIFETLNTRGKDLQVSHLVKNHFSRLLKATNKNIDIAKHSWEQLLETFETSQADLDIDSFLHHFWLSREDYVTEKKLFTLMKKSINKDNAKSILDDMLSDAKLYRTIGEPGYGKWRNDESQLKSTLDALSIFRVRQPFPLVLSIMRSYQKKQITKKNAEAVLWAVECFHFTFTAIASKSSSGGLSLMYAALAQRMFKASTESERQKVLKEAKEKLKSRLPSKNDFIVEFKKLRYSDEFTKQKRLVKYVLARIERHLSKSGVAVDYDKMTIEHVASQNPSSPDTISADHVGMLGNLLLCDDKLQNKLKNKPFSEKKKVLIDSGVAAKDSITSTSDWDATAIEARTQALAELAYDHIWKT